MLFLIIKQEVPVEIQFVIYLHVHQRNQQKKFKERNCRQRILIWCQRRSRISSESFNFSIKNPESTAKWKEKQRSSFYNKMQGRRIQFCNNQEAFFCSKLECVSKWKRSGKAKEGWVRLEILIFWHQLDLLGTITPTTRSTNRVQSHCESKIVTTPKAETEAAKSSFRPPNT